MSVLDKLYANIKATNTTGKPFELPEIEYHYIHYSRFLIEDKLAIKLSLQETKKYLYEEGLLPDEYYFSPWYIQKYSK